MGTRIFQTCSQAIWLWLGRYTTWTSRMQPKAQPSMEPVAASLCVAHGRASSPRPPLPSSATRLPDTSVRALASTAVQRFPRGSLGALQSKEKGNEQVGLRTLGGESTPRGTSKPFRRGRSAEGNLQSLLINERNTFADCLAMELHHDIERVETASTRNVRITPLRSSNTPTCSWTCMPLSSVVLYGEILAACAREA